MGESTTTRKRWQLTPDGFEALLTRLSADREEAGRNFEQHRRYLITLLTYAGASDSESLADTALDRAAKRLAAGDRIDDVRAWLRGAARKVLLEAGLDRRRELHAAGRVAEIVPDVEEDHLRLERCLGRLPPESRELIERYYQPEAKKLYPVRKRLADELGLSANNLRTRALRIRKSLEECFRKQS